MLNSTRSPIQSLPRASSGKGGVSAPVTRHEITQEELEEIGEAFAVFDADTSGQLHYRQLKVAMRALGFAVKKADVLRLLHERNMDEHDAIDQEMFTDIMKKKMSEREESEKLQRAFQLFDDDGTGRISLKNLRRVAKEMGDLIHDDELAAMIHEFDKDGDGEISSHEFSCIMSTASS
mmetsp:Transcript_37277/g.71458  ORF Transcript_37277/g.71458 Transcript_37277/m.71458 type:complete len:178 (-) Transcript_37277:418-951(-)|eukprot:CAMPEP_0114252876 /NCGR_PEP_ID=MMETSP0058-20121206/16083_1 /TAXON_ID=36894 /ORGANISM="Pyramimonas parkeae, CCMP726" /LENGTH=177 /DNA_ID=CAMNT_0001366865 /DNA_START=241 /DNA_END=774 /DNA_ORIENTATION=-